MADERGPSWWDVADLCQRTADAYHCSVELHLGWPIKRIDGRGYSSWCASVTLTARTGKPQLVFGAHELFGRGGSFATAPAAFYRALLEAQAKWDNHRAQREAAATF